MVFYYPLLIEHSVEFKRFSRKYLSDLKSKYRHLIASFQTHETFVGSLALIVSSIRIIAMNCHTVTIGTTAVPAAVTMDCATLTIGVHSLATTTVNGRLTMTNDASFFGKTLNCRW